MNYSGLTADEIDVFHLLAGKAGEVAYRLLAERGAAHLNDFTAEAGRRILRQAWQEVAEVHFAGDDAANLQSAILEFVEAMIGCCAPVDAPPPTLH
jgi:hypothetical protein